MYYPFLRARQFELIALRELAIHKLSQKFIRPIFEPVKASTNNLKIANKIFNETNQIAYLILNPKVGELEGKDQECFEFYRSLVVTKFIPAFHYLNNGDYIKTFIKANKIKNCLLVCESEINSEDADFRKLVERPEINCISVESPDRNRSLNRYLKELNKTYLRFDDLFERQVRNSNYLGISEHRFSEEHIYYSEEGFSGFSDYTVLSSEFSSGGSTPLAVVIHLTYLKENNQIWIRHFTSFTNDSIVNVQGKFAEAAEKAVDFCRQEGLDNLATQELIKYYENEHYPGLGTVKKIAIKNHILVVNQFLSEK